METDGRQMAAHVRRIWPDLEGLFATGEEVRALIGLPGWEAVTQVLAAEIADVNRRLDYGREPLTRAEYAMAHGRLGGLMAMQDAALAILARYEHVLTEQRAQHESAGETARNGSM